MNRDSENSSDGRPLTVEEHGLVLWLLEHGEKTAASFLAQLVDARVVAGCPCGCASVDFAIAGVRASTNGGMTILSDYCWRDACGHELGVFVFARNELLAGLELWSIDGQAIADRFPQPEELQPFGETRG